MNGNGYVKAYHCILDEANHELRGGKFQVFYFIYRMTVGWNMYSVAMSLKEFERQLALSANSVAPILDKLEEEGWIHISRCKTTGGKPYMMYSMGERVYHPRNLGNIPSLSPKKLGWSEEILPSISPKKLGQEKQISPKKLGGAIINKDNSFKDKKKDDFWNFSDIIYDREKPPEKMWALQKKLNDDIYDMSNLWCEEHFDCLRFLMEHCEFNQIYELAQRAKSEGIECNAALEWMVDQTKT